MLPLVILIIIITAPKLIGPPGCGVYQIMIGRGVSSNKKITKQSKSEPTPEPKSTVSTTLPKDNIQYFYLLIEMPPHRNAALSVHLLLYTGSNDFEDGGRGRGTPW